MLPSTGRITILAEALLPLPPRIFTVGTASYPSPGPLTSIELIVPVSMSNVALAIASMFGFPPVKLITGTLPYP